ncbi:MAG: rhomboid family intramembrane serine protease [Spirochaetaceae bacterium]|jgi:membrane associated rhomboid family serine protease|nr:rhomboid family intramembrane serine protease [Spirochaetaceae bacterium]
MRIKYNAPVVLTYTIISLAVLILSYTLFPDLTWRWFAVPGKHEFSLRSIRNILTLATHAAGHINVLHFISNFSLILILGPMLEEHYGSRALLFMMAVTALVTGALNAFLFSTGLLGASGVVFMMILLGSFTNFRRGEIPLTFILVTALYLGKEALSSFEDNNISEFGHIIGGICGSLFGFQNPSKRDSTEQHTSGHV